MSMSTRLRVICAECAKTFTISVQTPVGPVCPRCGSVDITDDDGNPL